jgi:hypothetical protein
MRISRSLPLSDCLAVPAADCQAWHRRPQARRRPLPPLWSPPGVLESMRSHSRTPLDYFSQVGQTFLLTFLPHRRQAKRSLVRQRPFGACFPHSFPSTRASSSQWVCIPVRMRPLIGRVELSRLPVRGAFAQRVFRPRRQRVVNRACRPMEWRGALVPNRAASALLSCRSLIRHPSCNRVKGLDELELNVVGFGGRVVPANFPGHPSRVVAEVVGREESCPRERHPRGHLSFWRGAPLFLGLTCRTVSFTMP